MAYFGTKVLDNQIKALPTIKSVPKNLLDKSKIVQGAIKSINGDIDSSSAIRVTSDFIRVVSGQTYIFSIESGKKFVTFHYYALDKSNIGENVPTNLITIPSGVSYIRVAMGFDNNSNIVPSDVNSAQLEQGAIITPYEPHTIPIATFDTDMTENLIDVVCDIQYSQASGTPTPQDEKPIGVYDHLTLYHNSINLWDEQVVHGTINNSTGVITYGGNFWLSEHPISVKSETDYYFVAVNSKYCLAYWYDASMNYLGYVDNVGSINKTLTSPTGARYLYLRFFSNVTVYNVGDFSVNYPSTDTDYHAFNGTYIPFGQTVAKGKLNVTNGVLNFEQKITVYNGSENWVEQSGTYRIEAPTDGKYDGGLTPCIETSNLFIPALTGNNLIRRDLANFVITTNEYASLSDFKTALSNTNLQIVYPLATPQTVQLSSTTIQALLNENNIWCDTGDIEVKFVLSVGSYVNQNV